jgi:hypothetical protein
MDPEVLARRSLQADGALCVTAGTVVLVARKMAAQGLGLPVPLVVAAGGATTMWGGGLLLAGGRRDWRTPTATAAAVNTVAADGLGLLALVRGRGGPRTGTLLLAGAMGAFGLVQGYAWWRGRGQDQRGATDDAPVESPSTSPGVPS